MKIFSDCKIVFMLFSFLSLLLTGPVLARAQEGEPKLNITIHVAKEVKQFKNNKWIVEYVPVVETRRDDVLVYTITYTNEGNAEAKDAAIVDPIPNGTVYLMDSAKGKDAEITCSIDGGRYFQPPPAKYTVQKPDGTWVQTIAPADMYTHIKWTIRKPVVPGESGELGFKVIVR